MKSLRISLRQSGYDAEEAYFYAREIELIENLHAEQPAEPTKLRLIQGEKSSESDEIQMEERKQRAA